MPKQVLKVVNFGGTQGGLSTVGYTVYNTDGTEAYSRSTSGVVELGTSTGVYAANVTMPDIDSVVLWDTGGATPKYATEDYQTQLNRIDDNTDKIQKIWNSIKNQGEFMAALMDRLGLIQKNEGMQKVSDKLDVLASKETLSLNNIESAFNNAVGKISLKAPDVKIDYSNQLSQVSAQISGLREDLSKMGAKKDYTGNFSNLIELLKNTQKTIDKSLGEKSLALSKEINSIKTVFSKLDSIVGMIQSLNAGVEKAADKKEIIDAIKNLNAFIKRLGMTQQDLSILQAFGHKR